MHGGSQCNVSRHPADFDLILQFPSIIPPLSGAPSPQGKQWQKMALSAVRCHYSFTRATCPTQEALSKTVTLYFMLNHRQEVENILLTGLHVSAPLRQSDLKLWVYFTGRGVMGQDVSATSPNRNEISFGAWEEGVNNKLDTSGHSKSYFKIKCLCKVT